MSTPDRDHAPNRLPRRRERTAVVATLLAIVTAWVVLLVGSPASSAAPAGDTPSTTEPVGVDTTDPESADEDSGGATWLRWLVVAVVVGALVALGLVYLVRSGRDATSGGSSAQT